MGLVLAFLIGYSVGGRNGRDDLDEILVAARQVMGSEEFQGLVRLLRSHVGAALTDLGTAVSTGSAQGSALSVLEKAQSLMAASARLRATSSGA
jgi:hypothetical protein